LAQSDDFYDVSAEYYFEIENGEPILRLSLRWLHPGEPADVPDLDEALFSPQVSFLRFSSLAFEEHEKLRQWIRDRPADEFNIRTGLSCIYRDGSPQRLLVGLKVSRGSSEDMIYATPRDFSHFAPWFESAFRDETQVWKIAVREDRPDEVWVMRFGLDGVAPIALLAGETPSFFVLPPLSQRPWSQFDVPIWDFTSSGIDFNNPPTRTMAFANIDPESWMLQFLRDTRAIPEGHVTRNLRETWDRIEENLACRVIELDHKQPRTDPTSARERLRAAIRSDVSAYANLAIVQLPVGVNNEGLVAGWAQLHGTVGPTVEGTTFSSSAINVHQQQSELVFVVTSSNPHPVISTNVRFEAKSVDISRGADMRFLVSDDPCLRMSVAKPFAVRGVQRSISVPVLRVQHAVPSVDEPKTIDEVLSWNYGCEFSYEQNLNDVAVFDFAPDRQPEPPTNDDVFRALAQHIITFPQIRGNVTGFHQMKALIEMSERLLAALVSTPTPSPIDGGGPFRVAMRNEDINGIGHIRVLSPPPDRIPSVGVGGMTTEPTSTPGLYQFRHSRGHLLSTEELLAGPERYLEIPMHLDSQASIRMGMRIDRNAALYLDSDVQPLLVRGDMIPFPLLVPSLDSGTAIAIGGSRGPLASHLAEPFTRLLRHPFRIEGRYSAGVGEIPVFRVDRTDSEPPDPAQVVTATASSVETWMRSFEVSAEGTLTFEVTLLAGTATLLRTRLLLNVADIER
jgi:hypothetical protein